MKKFIYRGESSDTILDDPLFMCEFEVSSSLPYSTREVIKGDTSIYRNVPNFYGVKESDGLILPIGFVKETGKPFLIEDREAIETLFYGVDKILPITIIDSNGRESEFRGIATSIDWRIVADKIIGCVVNFECISSFWYSKYKISDEFTAFEHLTIINKSSDKYTYPKVTIENTDTKDIMYSITNRTDNKDKTMRFIVKQGEKVTIDTERCIVVTGNTYADLGWEDIDYIYWIKLLSGDNDIFIDGGNAIVTFEFYQKHRGLGSYFGNSSYRNYKKEGAVISGDTLILNGIGNIEDKSLVVTGTLGTDSLIL